MQLVVTKNTPLASWRFLPTASAMNVQELQWWCMQNHLYRSPHHCHWVFSLIGTFTSALTTVGFSYLHTLFERDYDRKTSLNPGDTGAHSAPEIMLVSVHTCLTTSTALPIHDLPLFSLFLFSTKGSLCLVSFPYQCLSRKFHAPTHLFPIVG